MYWSSIHQIFNVLQLFVVDTIEGRRIELPTLSSAGHISTSSSSGIHAICLSPNNSLLAVGGGNRPNDLSIYGMPDLCPLVVGEVSLKATQQTLFQKYDIIYMYIYTTGTL